MRPTYTCTLFTPEDAEDLAAFLNEIYRDHWTLSAAAFRRRPDQMKDKSAYTIIEEELLNPNLVGFYILKKNEKIIATQRITDKFGDGRVAYFCGTETHPDYQKKATTWRHLLRPCFDKICEKGFARIDLTTWTFNRKGIPLYKRGGFRALPGTSLVMENYLPAILRHPAARPYFKNHCFLKTMCFERSYGYDDVPFVLNNDIGAFEYCWQVGEDRLYVMVDFRRKHIAWIEKNDWAVGVYAMGGEPCSIHYRIENRGKEPLRYNMNIGSEGEVVVLGAGSVCEGNRTCDGVGGVGDPLAILEVWIDGEYCPFPVFAEEDLGTTGDMDEIVNV